MSGTTEKVRALLKRLKVSEPPVPVEKVAELFSVKIIPYDKLPDNISGFTTTKPGFPVIAVNSKHSSVRQRFTIAHELGHFLLGHKIEGAEIDEMGSRPTNNEKEANDFAAELLIPRDILKSDIRNHIATNIPDLARRYNVSEQAMSIHLLHTGMIFDIKK